jgi:DNA-binding CsgD family transcriptional regulator
MELAPRDLEQLLTSLFEGTFEDPLWSTFLGRLRSLTRSTYTSLIFRPVNMPLNALVELFSGERSPPRLQQAYSDEMHLRDPLPHYSLEDGRVYRLSELLKLHDPQHAAFHRDLIEPSGMSAMRIVRVIEASGVSGWLTIARPAPDFDESQDALLRAIAPHLRSALRHYVAFERQRFQLEVAGDAFRRLNYGWLTLDAGGRVVDIDVHAGALIERGSALRRLADGRLVAAHAEVGRELAHALKSFAANPRGRPRAVHLSREPWTDLLLVPLEKRAISAQAAPVLIAYIHTDGWSTADRCQQLAELFRLSHSEARLTLAISRGLTLAEAATELDLTLETARNYSKRVYAKTGARGQSDLIRFVLASVLALA